MSKIKLALDVVSDLRSLAGSIETLVQAIEAKGTITEDEAATGAGITSETATKASDETEKATKKRTKTTTKAKAKATEKQPTLEEVRAAMAEKSRDGHREAVKAIITKYGANNLSSLDPKHYAAALKEAGDLK